MSGQSRSEFGDGTGTRLESFEEIREALGVGRTPTVREPVQQQQPTDIMAYRPVRRPPMALLCIQDDGRDDGEWIRIRSERFVLGRTDGDFRIPHDDMMSSRHAELIRQIDRDRYRWFLVDLQSTNGTYLRVTNALLRNGQEFLIGSHRFRFSAGLQGTALPEDNAGKGNGTRGWQTVSPTDLVPSLVELTPRGEGQRFYLDRPEHWVGRDAGQCDVCLSEDLMVNPRHARLYRDEKGRWRLENARSRNGVWLRIERMPIDSTAQFQLGEQRFQLRIL